MKELIYAGIEVENLVKKQFPKAKITDASDYIHRERFDLHLDVPEKEFYLFAIENGFALVCFAFRCRMMQGDSEIKSWIKELEKAKSAKDKCCLNCDSILDFEGDDYICHGCGQVYPITRPQKKEANNVKSK